MNELPLKKFTVSNGALVAEASDFGPFRDGYWWLQELYLDSCDLGIVIRSDFTDRFAGLEFFLGHDPSWLYFSLWSCFTISISELTAANCRRAISIAADICPILTLR